MTPYFEKRNIHFYVNRLGFHIVEFWNKLVNKDKVKSMKQMRQIMIKFQERNGATQCKLLKGIGTKVVLRECPDCVADAAEFLEEQLNG